MSRQGQGESRASQGNQQRSNQHPHSQGARAGNERSFQKQGLSLTCHRDQDSATAVCGDCGVPLCTDHHNSLTDPVFGHFTRSTRPLLLSGVLLFIFPLAWILTDPVSILEQEGLSVPSGTGTVLLHSSLILGFAFGFTVWMQGADRKTSARFLALAPPERILCEECHASTAIQRFIYASLALLGVGLVVLSVYLAWDGSSLYPLRGSALGAGLLVARTNLTLFVSKLVE